MSTLIDFLYNPPAVIWPLCLLLGILAVGRQFATDVRPIFIAVRDGVAKQAQSNAPAYAICILFGMSASASAFIDVFHQLTSEAFQAMSWHTYATLWVKVFNPFIVAVLAYATQNKFVQPTPQKTVTNPPIPTQ
jgi:hypothetical protein